MNASNGTFRSRLRDRPTAQLPCLIDAAALFLLSLLLLPQQRAWLEGQGVLHPGKFLRSQPCACALLLLCFAMLGCFCLVIMVRPGWLAHIISHWVEMRNKVQFSKKGRADQFKASMVEIIERIRGRKKIFFEWSGVFPQDLVLANTNCIAFSTQKIWWDKLITCCLFSQVNWVKEILPIPF